MLNRMAVPKNDRRYLWTNHVVGKMLVYRISPSLVKRIVRFPSRVEEGIADATIAVMKPAERVKRREEIWVMYQLSSTSRIKVITAWRYPDKSPARHPVPSAIMEEVAGILNH